MENVVGYVRTSPGTDKEGNKTSIPNQKRMIEEYCDENDLNLVEIFSDVDTSGRKKRPHKREGFKDLTEEVNNREEDSEYDEVTKIIVKDMDRLSRDDSVLKGLEFYLDLHHLGSVEVIETDGIMTEALDQIDNVIGDMDDGFEKKMLKRAREDIEQSGMEIKEIKALITSAKTKTALEGKMTNNEPVGTIGYGLVTDKVKHGKDKATKYLPDDEKEDHFSNALKAINTIEHLDFPVDNPSEYEGDSLYSIGKRCNLQVSNYTTVCKNLWERRWLYRFVAMEHRPQASLILPDEIDKEEVEKRAYQ